MLTTLARLRAVAPATADVPDADCTLAILAAIEAVRNYCHRQFSRATYRRWIDADGDIWLPEWPVSMVRMVGKPVAAGTLSYAGSQWDAPTWSIDAYGITLMSEPDGSPVEATILWTDEPTLADLAEAIGGQSDTDDWSYSGHPDDGMPSRLLRPSSGSGTVGAQLEAADPSGVAAPLLDDRRIAAGHGATYVEWVGGYADDSVPDDLQHAICLVAADLIKDGYGIAGVQSESIGDYSYSIGAARDKADEAARARAALLDPYARIGWR